MTREQLDAIRARVERDFVPRRPDVFALLEEVERLRDAHAMAVQVSGELCEKCGWAMKFPEEPCRCELLAEVERLTAERDAAFARGVAAMREAAVAVASKRANLQRFTDSDCAWGRSAECIRDELRHLPVPEDKS